MDDDFYKEESEIPKTHDSLINTSADDVIVEEEKENIAYIISQFNYMISSFLEIESSKYETEECQQLTYEIINMIKKVDENEKSANYENCFPFFSALNISELIHCIFNCVNNYSISYIRDISDYISLIIARLTQVSTANFGSLLDYPILDGLSTIFQCNLPEKTFKYLIIFIRNMLDGEETFQSFSQQFGIQFFEFILNSLQNFTDECRCQISEYIIMCLYTFTKYGYLSFHEDEQNSENRNHEDEESINQTNMELSCKIFQIQLKLIDNIKEKPLAIGFLAYSWTNMIENHSFDFSVAKNNHIENIIDRLLSYFIKPYEAYTKTDQDSIGNVLFFISHLMNAECDIDFPEVDFSFLCDIMRNGNESLFHYASLILSQQVFKSNDPEYLKEIIDFMIELFDSSTQKKLDISLFICDVICADPCSYDFVFKPEVMHIIFETMLLDHSDEIRTTLYPEAIYKMCLIADEIGQTDNIMTFLCEPENKEKIEEFEEIHGDEPAGDKMHLVLQYIEEKQNLN